MRKLTFEITSSKKKNKNKKKHENDEQKFKKTSFRKTGKY